MATAAQLLGLVLVVIGMYLWFGLGAGLVAGGAAVTTVAVAADLGRRGD